MNTYNIIENPKPSYLEHYEDFVRLYNDTTITVEDIRKVLGLNIKQYSLARQKALDEGLIRDRRTFAMMMNKGRPKKEKQVIKYYSKQGKNEHYIVRKIVDGEYRYFGSYTDEDTACRIVEELKKHNWDKEYLPLIQDKVMDK